MAALGQGCDQLLPVRIDSSALQHGLDRSDRFALKLGRGLLPAGHHQAHMATGLQAHLHQIAHGHRLGVGVGISEGLPLTARLQPNV